MEKNVDYIKMTKNKLKPLVLLGAAMFMATITYAQSIAPQTVNSGGTKMTQANGSLSFTVGELVLLNLTDSEGNTLSKSKGYLSFAKLSKNHETSFLKIALYSELPVYNINKTCCYTSRI